MLDEALEILTAAWSGEPVHHRGEHYTAVRFQGFFPVDLEHPDQVAESVAELASVRKEIGRDEKEPFDVVAALPVGTDPAPYASAGATWWMVELPWDKVSSDQVPRCDPRRTGAPLDPRRVRPLELEAIVKGDARTAGFDQDQVNRPPAPPSV